MDDKELETRIAGLERTQRVIRRSFVLVGLILAVGLVFAFMRKPPDRPRVDAHALDLLLRAVHDHDQGCSGHAATESPKFDEFRQAVLHELEIELATTPPPSTENPS